MKIFQTSSFFETNKFHHGGPPFSGGPGAIAPVAPPLIRPWLRSPTRPFAQWNLIPRTCNNPKHWKNTKQGKLFEL